MNKQGSGGATCPPATAREAAHAIEQQPPGWMVLYGLYSHQFVAFPLFPAPRGTILTAAYPPALITRIQQAEQQILGKPRHHREL